MLYGPAALGRRFVGRINIVDQCRLIRKIDAWNVPVLLNRPISGLTDKVRNSRVADFNLVLLLSLRLGERQRVGRILIGGTDSKLLVLRVDQNLNVRSIVQFSGGLIVELQNVAGHSSNRCGTGSNEVNDGEFL